MSRTIKFRLWDGERYWYNVAPLNNEEALTQELTNGECEWEYNNQYAVRKGVVEQSTGVKAKNGEEINEGDIVNVIGVGVAQVIDSPSGEWMLSYMREPDEINNGFVSVVPKNKPSGLWKASTTSYIEVIGNIHQNPELLEDL